MSVHKFGKKPVSLRQQLLTIHWEPRMDVKYPAQKRTPVTWEIFTQEQLSIPAHGTKTVLLGFGFMMSKGMILASLKQDLKYKRCSLQNETILESVDDIIITIQNNSDAAIVISENTPLCFVHYLT